MEKHIKRPYQKALANNSNVFDVLEQDIADWYDTPCHSLGELKRRQNKKDRGDLFEDFCKTYLEHVGKYDTVWLLSEVPDDTLSHLGLKRQDLGIDLIGVKNGDYHAVQVKYRKKTGKKRILTWKQLSTFYALCLRTGPWSRYVVMTNCDYIRSVSKRTEKDKSICLKSFQGISNENWIKMCELKGNTVEQTDDEKKETIDEGISQEDIRKMREARLMRFGS